MTTVIDERVVEMRFNNADFEKNVAQSMETLDKLKKSLNFDSAKSLENIGKVSKSFSMENVGSQVETVQAKFSALQVVGVTALAELTKSALSLGSTIIHKVIDPIKTGGMNRALNIEKAKFQLEGLHVAWEQISDDINYGVKDTAYGLDAAAKAASQLVTSGVQFGAAWGETGNSPMARALRGISGVAAMTSSTYEDISEIFTSIAGKGKAMTGEFNRLGQRGLNAAGAVADYFNKVNEGTVETTESVKRKVQEMTGGLKVTELDIREFATKSKIDFELFSYAMDEAFGEHAKEANKTFEGALSNVKAALSRIGEKFAAPYIENARKVFNDLIPVLNAVNKALTPLADRVSTVMGLMQESLSRFLNSEGVSNGITVIIDSLVRAFDGLAKILGAVRVAFDSVFPPNEAGSTFFKVANAIAAFVDKVVSIATATDTLVNLFSFFQGLFSVGKLIVDIFKGVLQAIIPVEHPIQALFTIMLNILGLTGRILTFVTTLIRENLSLTSVLQILASVAEIIGKVLVGIAAVLGGGIIYAIRNFGSAVNWVLNLLRDLSSTIGSVFNRGLDTASSKISSLTSFFDRFTSHAEKANTVVKEMPKNYGAAGESVVQFGTLTRDATEEVNKQTVALRWYEKVFIAIKTAMTTAVRVVMGVSVAIASAVVTFFSTFGTRFAEATKDAHGFIDYIKGFFVTLLSYFGTAGAKITEFFSKLGASDIPLIQKIKGVATAIKDFITNLGPGRLSALAFAAAMMGLVAAAIKVAVSFSTLVTSVRRVFTTVETILKSKFFTTKSPSLVMQLAEAFAIMAVSLGLLTKLVDPNALRQTAEVMTELMVTFTLCAGALRIIDFVISKMGLFSNFKLVNSTILSLAVSMGILVAAFAVLNKIEIANDWKKKLGIMAIMFAEVAAAAIIVSKLAPKLAGGSILMLTLALAMKTMVDAFSKIQSADLENISKNIVGFTAIFFAVAALTAAAGRLRLSSAIGLLIIAKSFNIIMPMLSEAIAAFEPLLVSFNETVNGVVKTVDDVKKGITNFFEKLNGFFEYIHSAFSEIPATVISCVSMVSMALVSIASLAAIIAGGFAIAAIITAIGSLGNLLKGFAFAVIGVAIAIKIVTDSFITIGSYLKDLSSSQYSNIMAGFATLALILTGMVGVVTLIDAFASLITRNAFFNGKTVRTSFLGIGMAFAGIGVALLLITKSLNGLEKIPEERFWDLIKGISLILVCLGVAAAGAGLVTKGGAAIVGLIGVVASFALLLAGVAVLSMMWTPENQAGMVAALLSLVVIAASLTAVLFAFSKLKNASSILALMIPALLMLVTISGLLIAIGSMSELNTGGMVVAMAGLAGTIFVVIQLLKTISASSGLNNTKKIGVLAAAIGLLATAAAAIAGLALVINYAGGWSIAGAILALNLQLLAIYKMMNLIAGMRAVGTGLKSKLVLLASCVGSLLLVAITIGAFAAAIKATGGSYIIGAMAALNGQLLLILGMMWAITKIKMDNGMVSRLVLLGACVATLAVVAIALGVLANNIKKNGLDTFNTGFNALATILLEVGAVMAVVGLIGSTLNEWSKVVGTGAIFVGAIGAVWEISNALMKLSEIDPAQLDSATQAMKAIITAMGIMTGLLGVLQVVLVLIGSAFGSAAGGWAGAVALPLLITAVGFAVIEMGAGLYIGAKAIEVLASALGLLIDPLKRLSELPLAELAVNLMDLGTSLVHAGIGLAVFDVAAGVGALIIAYLASTFSAMNEVLPTFTSSMESLAGLDLGGIAAGLVELGLAGLVLEAGAPGVAAYALAIGGLATALSAYNGASGGVAAIKETGEVMETFTVQAETYGAEFGGNYASGILTKDGEIQSATRQVVDGQVSILEEATPKAAEATEEMGNVILQGTEYTYEEVGKMARKYGFGTTQDFIRAAEKGLVDLNPKGFVEKKVDEIGTVVVDKAGDIKDDVLTEIKNFDLEGALSNLPDVFGRIGTLCGTLLGQNASKSALDAISKMLGSFSWLFKQSGFLNGMSKEISQFGANGMPTAVMNKMYGGLASTQSKLLNSGLSGFFDETLEKAQNLIPTIDDLGTSFENAGEKAGKAGKSAKDFASSLAETLEGQLNFFEKLELKSETTAEQLLSNMRSNIDGFASWSHRMTVLAERFNQHGIDISLYDELAKMGVQGYDTMNAIYNMTDEQLEELRGLWETKMTLPQGQADIVASGYQYMGEMATQGFSDALKEHKGLHEAIHGFTDYVLSEPKKDLGINSPSKEFFKYGVDCINGYGLGLTSDSAMAMLELCCGQVTDKIKEFFTEGLSEENMEELGTGLISNIFASLLETTEDEETNPIVQSLVTALSTFDLIDEALTTFTDHIKEYLYQLWEIPGEGEPSAWVTRLVQNSIAQAIVTALDNSFVLFIAPAVLNICNNTVKAFTDAWSMEVTEDGYGRSEVFYNIGLNAMQGLIDGIEEKGAEAISLAESIASEIKAIFESVWDENSPSKVFRKIGSFAMEGLTIGIEDGATNVYSAAQSVAEGTLDVMSNVGRLQDVLNEGMDLNPVITPMLDLSLIRSQMDELNALMSSPEYDALGQNGGDLSGIKNPSQVSFVQNNYSPKALSRYEIYRQTKNQISQLKGAIG